MVRPCSGTGVTIVDMEKPEPKTGKFILYPYPVPVLSGLWSEKAETTGHRSSTIQFNMWI